MPDSLPLQHINRTNCHEQECTKQKLVLAQVTERMRYQYHPSQTDRTPRWNRSQGPCRAPYHRKNPSYKPFHESAKADNKNALIGYIQT